MIPSRPRSAAGPGALAGLCALVLLHCGEPAEPTALGAAVVEDDLEAVRALLDHADANPDGFGGDGQAPVHLAARRGDTEIVGLLLEAGADLDLRDRKDGWTPLLHAIHWRSRAAAAALIEAGADVDARGGSGTTPLFLAAGYGMEGIVRLLLEHGADPRAEVRGANALWAAAGGSAIRNPAEGPPLGHCFPEVLDALLTAAPDLKLGGRIRSRVLHWLANDHCEAVVSDLLTGDFSLR